MLNLDNITERNNNKDWPYRKLWVLLEVVKLIIYYVRFKKTTISLIKFIYMRNI